MKDYKRLNLLLIAGILLVGLAAYFFSIRGTLELWSENAVLKDKLQVIEQISANGPEWQMVNNPTGQARLAQEEILQALTDLCRENSLKLVNFEKPAQHLKEGYEITSHPISFQGYYKDMMRVLYDIEHKHRLGKVSNVNFFVNVDRRTKKRSLQADILIQTLKDSQI